MFVVQFTFLPGIVSMKYTKVILVGSTYTEIRNTYIGFVPSGTEDKTCTVPVDITFDIYGNLLG